MDGDPLDALNALGDATRRRVYDHVAGRPEPVSRDDAAAALGIGRTLAAYHLDRLAAEGLLEVAYERRTGRSGPGAGRPSKLYSRPDREIAVSVPPRDYHLAARLLADAAAADAEGTSTRRALAESAERLGHELAGEAGPAPELDELLRERGYEPYADGPDVLRLRNCPFHAVAQRHPEVICEMNLALLRGLVDGLGDPSLAATLEPGPGRCCVALRRRSSSDS
jgi:predicted ArsR family transcriptional regulator